MGWLGRLIEKLRGPPQAPPSPPQSQAASDAKFERLAWLEPHENPFGVRVLDCRPIAETFVSLSENPAAIRFFGSAQSRSGEQFRGSTPRTPSRSRAS